MGENSPRSPGSTSSRRLNKTGENSPKSPGSTSSRRMSKEMMEKVPRLFVTEFKVPHAQPRPGGYLKIPKGPFDYTTMNKTKSEIEPVVLQACRCNEKEICEELECEAMPKFKPNESDPDVIGPTPEKDYSFRLPPQHDTTRNFRILRALDESHLTDFTHHLTPNISATYFNQTSRSQLTIPGSTPVNILAIVVSTIMLLSSENNVPGDMLDATVAYLKLVRDHDGNVPPNMQGIFNHIMLLRGEIPLKRARKCKINATRDTSQNRQHQSYQNKNVLSVSKLKNKNKEY